MCRIAGIVTNIHADKAEADVAKMLKSLAHGGPDGEGIFAEGSVYLGHRRLSIIDLSDAGLQPMSSSDGKIMLTFNGEIYNYRQLREELRQVGTTFKTQTDSEVILAAYQAWGTSAFDRFQGIFAFALYDRLAEKILLVRDHFGVKPLYYSWRNDRLVFASEVRAFRAFDPLWPENADWKTLFLAFGSLPFPHTTLSGVQQLSPGSWLEFNLRDFTFQNTLFTSDKKQVQITETSAALSAIRDEVHEAVKRNLVADAPLGVFLSGGIDSTLLTLLADKTGEGELKTLSVTFQEASFDERPFQELVLAKTKQAVGNPIEVTESLFRQHIEDIWNAMDQPSIDGVNTYFVSKSARSIGLKATLSGLGADEFFGGYASFNRITLARILRLVPLKRFVANIFSRWKETYGRLMFLIIPGAVGDYLFLRGLHTPDVIAKILGIPEVDVWKTLKEVKVTVPAGLTRKEYAAFLETKMYMTNQLLKDTDVMSMWHGLEVRVPFLDIALTRKTEVIAPAIRFCRDRPKYLLTAAFEDVIPTEIIYRKKKGFTFPFEIWIRNGKAIFEKMLPVGDAVTDIVTKFEQKKCHWSKYWSLVVLNEFKIEG